MAHQGLVLARWRKAKGWSQEEAARRFGITQAGWSPWETGAKTPDLQNALKLEAFTDGAVTTKGWANSRKAARARGGRARVGGKSAKAAVPKDHAVDEVPSI